MTKSVCNWNSAKAINKKTCTDGLRVVGIEDVTQIPTRGEMVSRSDTISRKGKIINNKTAPKKYLAPIHMIAQQVVHQIIIIIILFFIPLRTKFQPVPSYILSTAIFFNIKIEGEKTITSLPPFSGEKTIKKWTVCNYWRRMGSFYLCMRCCCWQIWKSSKTQHG